MTAIMDKGRMAGRGWRRLSAFGTLAALGGVMALGQMPFDLPWLSLAAVVVTFALAMGGGTRGARLKAGFATGWALGCGYFLVALHWIYHPFMVDPARDGWMAPFGLFFMVTGLALFWGFGFAVARAFAPARLYALALVAAWAGAEMLRAHLFTGFPWALLAHGWIGRGLVQTAALWGAHGMNLALLLVAAVAGEGLARLAARPRTATGWAALVLPLAGLALADRALLPGPAAAPDPAGPVVRIVQPNVPQQEKDDPDAIPVYLRRLLDLSAEPGRRDLVVWPETALPWLLDYMPELLPETARAAAAPVAMGVMRNEDRQNFNALALIGEGGRVDAVYDKRHLVPFGEYVPFGDLLARFGIHGLAAADGAGYVAGRDAGLIDIPGIGGAWPMICYESIFPEEMVADAPRPRFMMLVTNDAWFGTFAGPYQHFAQGRLRAVEMGLPLVRAANTGISGVIDARGRVVDSLPLGVAGRIDVILPPAAAVTPYARYGDLPVAVALMSLLAIVAGLRRRNGIDQTIGRF